MGGAQCITRTTRSRTPLPYTTLVASKTRVAPMSKQTIPRLELAGIIIKSPNIPVNRKREESLE
jgi:hypothetical protein